MSRSLDVVLADDAVMLRDALRMALEGRGHVVRVVGDGQQLLKEIASRQPDLAVIDIKMPPTFSTEGIDAAHEITRRYPTVGVLLLSASLEVETIEPLLATGSGVGYLLKDRVAGLDDFLESVGRVADGGVAIDPVVVDALVNRKSRALPNLSSSEEEVLRLMAEGLNNRAIADRLTLSVKTIESRISNVFARLGLSEASNENRRVAAVLKYLRAQTPADGA